MVILFFKLEAGYLGIAVFALLITLFVTTRPFMGKGAVKKGFLLVGSALFAFIQEENSITRPSLSAIRLSNNQYLDEFFNCVILRQLPTSCQ
jgi:hypothetical protein